MRKLSIALIGVMFGACVCLAWAVVDEAPGARAYHDRIDRSIEAIAEDLPDIQRAAELAAPPLIAGKNLGIRGDHGLTNELSSRTGGLMLCFGLPGEPGDVILYALGVRGRDQLELTPLIERQIRDAARLKAAGSVVIALAGHDQLRALGLLDAATEACDVVLDNHAIDAATLGSPTQTVTNAITAWTFTCELFAACTRLGQTPAMHADRDGPLKMLRPDRHWNLRFHTSDPLAPIEPGKLGRRYLDRLRGMWRDVGTASWTSLAQTCDRATLTLKRGGKVYVRAGGPYLPYHYAGLLAEDHSLFTMLEHDGSNPNAPRPGKGDFVIAVGMSAPPGTSWWGNPEMLREGSMGTAWIISAFLTSPGDLVPGDIVVDQYWQPGDATVYVEGYDVPIGPVSGVISQGIYWMIQSQVAAALDR